MFLTKTNRKIYCQFCLIHMGKNNSGSVYSSNSKLPSRSGSIKDFRPSNQKRSTSKKYQSHQDKIDEEATTHKPIKTNSSFKKETNMQTTNAKILVKNLNKQFETTNLKGQSEEVKGRSKDLQSKSQTQQDIKAKKQILISQQPQNSQNNLEDKDKFPHLVTESEKQPISSSSQPNTGKISVEKLQQSKENDPFYANPQIQVKRRNMQIEVHKADYALPESYILALKVLQEKVQLQQQTIATLNASLSQKSIKLTEQVQRSLRLSITLQEVREELSQKKRQIKYLKGFLHELKQKHDSGSQQTDKQLEAQNKKLKTENSEKKRSLSKSGKNKKKKFGQSSLTKKSLLESVKQETFGPEIAEQSENEEVFEYLHQKQQRLLQEKEELDLMQLQLLRNKQIREEYEDAQMRSEAKRRSYSLNNPTRIVEKNAHSHSKQRLSQLAKQMPYKSPSIFVHTADKRPYGESPNYINDPVLAKFEASQRNQLTGRSELESRIEEKLSSNRLAVSKMRELMRNERDLVAMNYKLEAIQKSISANLKMGAQKNINETELSIRKDPREIHAIVDRLKSQYSIVKREIDEKKALIRDTKSQMERDEQQRANSNSIILSQDKSHANRNMPNFKATPKKLFSVHEASA